MRWRPVPVAVGAALATALAVAAACGDPYAESVGDTEAGSSTDAPAGLDAPLPEGGDAGGDARCANLKSDPSSCGECGHDCRGTACVDGRCAPAKLTGAEFPKCIALDKDYAYWTEAVQGGGAELRVRWAEKNDGGGASFDLSAVSVREDCQVVDGKLYFTLIAAGRGVEVTSVRSTTAYPIARGLTPRAFVITPPTTGGILYFIDDELSVKRCGTQCSTSDSISPAPTTLAAAQDAYALASDGIRLYWTTSTGAVSSIDPTEDGGAPSQLVSGESQPRGIAVDATHVYWATRSDGRLKRVVKTGGPVQGLATVNRPDAIVLDGAHLYWTSPLGGTIGRVPKSGGAPVILASDRVNPTKLAVDATHVYWIDSTTAGAIMRVAK